MNTKRIFGDMKKIFGFIGATTTIILAILGIISWFNLAPEKHSLEYMLSEPVQIAYSDKEKNDDYVYELVIKNNGKETIRGIRIKIDGTVKKLNDKKLGFSDQALVILPNEKSFEATYSELNAGETLRLSLQSPYIVKEIISISYPQGQAKFSSSSNGVLFWKILAIFLFMLLGYSWSEWLAGRIWIHCAYAELFDGNDLEKIYSIKKPWYISKKIFEHYRKDAIARFWTFVPPTYLTKQLFSETFAFQFLSQEKPEYLNDTEWEKNKNFAQEYLHKFLSEVNDHTAIQNILMLPRPTYCKLDFWNEKLIPTAAIRYRYCCINNALDEILLKTYDEQARILERTIKNIPASLQKDEYNRLKDSLSTYYRNALCGCIIEKNIDVKDVSESFDISILASFDSWRFKVFCDKIQAIKNNEEKAN